LAQVKQRQERPRISKNKINLGVTMKVESAVLRLIIHGDKGKLKPLFNTMYTEEGLANIEAFFNRKSGGEKGISRAIVTIL